MTSRPSTEQLLVQVLMRSLHDALRAAAQHPEGTEEHERAFLQLESAFGPIWNRLPQLTLSFPPDRVEWEGHVVLSAEEDDLGLAGLLARAGIHALTCIPGIEKREIRHFVDILDHKRRLDPDDQLDLVTRLFREDLQHMRYTVGTPSCPPGTPEAGAVDHHLASGPLVPTPTAVDRTASEAPGPHQTVAGVGARSVVAGRATAPAVRNAVREEAGRASRATGIVELEKFDSTLYFLDQREIEYLRSSIEEEYRRDAARSVLALLLDILETQPEPAVREEVLGVLTSLMPYLLGTARFKAVGYLMAELRRLARELELEARHKEVLDDLRVSLSEARALAQLFHGLDTGEIEATSKNLGILLRELRPEAIQTVLVWIGQLDRPDAKSALTEAVDGFFVEWPSALDRMLIASDRAVVRRALAIANKLRRPEFVDGVASILDKADEPTRALAVRVLASIGTASALRHVASLIDDPSGQVRRVVFETLSGRPYRGAEKGLKAAIDANDLEARELGERRALFEAYGAVAGAGGVSSLEPVLFGKGSIGRRASSETRACAAVAMGIIGTPAARFALQKAAKDKDPVVRSAAGKALREEAET